MSSSESDAETIGSTDTEENLSQEDSRIDNEEEDDDDDTTLSGFVVPDDEVISNNDCETVTDEEELDDLSTISSSSTVCTQQRPPRREAFKKANAFIDTVVSLSHELKKEKRLWKKSHKRKRAREIPTTSSHRSPSPKAKRHRKN